MRLTPPEQRARTSNSSQPSVSVWHLGGAIGLVAMAVFSTGIHDRSFVDEYAYITQSYYSDLFFGGRLDDPAWLDVFALDLQPLPKYFIGVGLRAANLRMPGPIDAARWYVDAHTQFGPPETLTVARIPFIATGVLGCVALYLCGVLIGGRWLGTIAALLLTINPLFRLHAHRAMSDVPCEAFLIAALGLALWGGQRIWSGRDLSFGVVVFAAAGVFSGLAILCKFNGFLAPMIVAAWCVLSLLIPRLSLGRKLGLLGGAALTISAAMVTFLAMNPALTAHPRGRVRQELASRASHGPWGRFRDMVNLRLDTSAGQQQMPKFLPDRLTAPIDKSAVFAMQGFGRFGPLGPTESNSKVRYELRQDWGLVFWWPLVVLGAVQTLRLGRQQLREGSPPSALALLIWAAVAWAVVAAYLPMAWDRYLLPIQAPNALLAATGVHGLWSHWRGKAVDE